MNFKFLRYMKIVGLFFCAILIYSNNAFATSDKITDLKQFNTSDNLAIFSNNTILMDYNTDTIIQSKNAFNKIFPASTTKLLTAILVLENLDLNSTTTASKTAIYSTPSGSSHISLKVGETLTIEELLYGLLLNSGNDAANVLAEAVSGNIKDFIIKMNEKAKEIGCLNTNFVNAHGFHNDNHYTTPYDMMKILKYAINMDSFKKICEAKRYVINETNLTNEKRYLKNTNKLLFNTNEDSKGLFYEYSLGGKTGYTIEARGAFVGYAKKGDTILLLGTFDGSQNVSGHEARFLDAVTLFNYGFNNFKSYSIFNKDITKFEVVDNVNNKKYILGLNSNIDILKENTKYNLDYSLEVDFNKLNEFDIKNKDYINNDINSTISYNVKNNYLSTANTKNLVLLDIKDLNKKNNNFIFILLGVLLIILLIIFLSKKGNSNKKKRRKRKVRNNLKYLRNLE